MQNLPTFFKSKVNEMQDALSVNKNTLAAQCLEDQKKMRPQETARPGSDLGGLHLYLHRCPVLQEIPQPSLAGGPRLPKLSGQAGGQLGVVGGCSVQGLN